MIRRHVDRISLRLEEVHAHLSEKSRQTNVELRVGEIYADAAAGAFAEADEIMRERVVVIGGLGVVEPTVGDEALAARENALVVVLEVTCLAHGDAPRDRIGAVFNGGIEYARKSLRGPVRESEC